jgi:hypothetical protein
VPCEEDEMRNLRYLLIVGVCAFGLLTLATPSAKAQVRIGVGIGVGPVYGGYYRYGYDPYYDPDYDDQDYDEPTYAPYGSPPDCLYGYYPYYPYACATYAYWGPEYFYDGVFVGVGPWFGWGFGPGFRGYFNDFDDFRRFGGFRGERFRDFRNERGFRRSDGGSFRRGEHGGGGFRGRSGGGHDDGER